jgi:hypothetical protein
VVTTSYQIVVPSIVSHEAQFYVDERDQRHEIDLQTQVQAGEIEELSASLDELTALQRCFHPDWLEGLHAGEQEALALVLSGTLAEGRFCSGDRVAIQALAALGLDDRGVSLEKALQEIGRSLNRTWRRFHQLTEAYFEAAIAEGNRRRLSGDGLTRSLWDQIQRRGKP